MRSHAGNTLLSVDLIETAVERAYGEVRMPCKQAELVREKLNKALANRPAASRAGPADRRDQAERQLEVAEASFADTEDTLGKALDLLADCQNAYLAAPS
jgi:hypothetical protein